MPPHVPLHALSLLIGLWCVGCDAASRNGPSGPTQPPPPPPPFVGDTTGIAIDHSAVRQAIDGFGGTTLPLVYGGVDYLGALRPAAIRAAYGEVGLRRGLFSVGVVEAPALAADPYAARGNDNTDPQLLNPAGFHDGGMAALWQTVLSPARSHGPVRPDLGALLDFRGPLDWLIPIRESDYERYLDEVAEHVLRVVAQWQATYGEVPRLIHLFNEPTSGNVELRSASATEVVDVVRRVGTRLRTAGFTTVRFVVPNEETMERSRVVAQAILADPVAREFVGAIGFHQYPYGSAYASPRRILEASGRGTPDPGARVELEALAALAAQNGVPLWMTEVTEGPGTTDYPFDAMEAVLARAIHVHDVFRYGRASAFFGMLTLWDQRSHADHFGGRGIPFYSEASGFVLIDQNFGAVRVTSMGHAVGHYARWLGDGASWIASTSSRARVVVSAFRDPAHRRVVAVVVNMEPTTQLLRVRLDGATIGGTVGGEISYGAARWEGVTIRRAADGLYEVVVPPSSVVTMGLGLD